MLPDGCDVGHGGHGHGHGHGEGISRHPNFSTPHFSWVHLLSSPLTDTQGQT